MSNERTRKQRIEIKKLLISNNKKYYIKYYLQIIYKLYFFDNHY